MKSIALKSAFVIVACSSVLSFAAIPEMRITTMNNRDPSVSGTNCSGCKYVKITNFALTGAGSHNLTLTPEPQGEADSIRVRGNSTSGIADKRPYRIKFDKKQGLFGKTPGKSWVLLANYYDGTFALNAIAFRLGQKLGLVFTPSFQFVDLYLNNSYKGIYLLTEQIQVNEGRVDVDPDYGFLVEFDYHDAASDEVKFTSAKYSLPTFIKSPEIESNFNTNNTKIKWVKDSIDALTNKMSENGFPTNGYRDKVDLESFAKYVLIQKLMDNFDFNNKVEGQGMTGQNMTGAPGSNYAYKDVSSRLYAGPLWDFDLAAGVSPDMGGMGGWGGGGNTCGFPAHFCMTDYTIKPSNPFYLRLWEDPVFLAKLKKNWDKYQNDFKAIPTFVDSIANLLGSSVNNNKYASSSGGMMGGSATLNTNTYNTEISKLKTWWTARMTFYGQEINKLNIDTSKDIEQPGPHPAPRPQQPPPASIASRAKFADGKKLVTVKNGFNINAASKASVEILSLNGSVVRKSKYAGGNHTVRLGNMPKGLYMVKVSVDGDKLVLRVPVR